MTLAERLEKSLKLPKQFKPQRTVKGKLCRSFSLDSHLFIEKFNLVYTTEFMENRNFRTKAIVDLLMSIECSLKSMCIALSKDIETPAEAYKKVRKHSHKLNKLYDEVEKRAKNRFNISPRKTIFKDLKKLGVSTRYTYDIWTLQLNTNDKEIFFGEDLISRTIDDIKWAETLQREAIKLNNLSNKCYAKYMAKHCILRGKKFKQYNKHLHDFLSVIARNS